ncbi:MAG: hypothetical protein ACRYFV_15530 [Janthinobacterium lividum]
MATSLLPLVGPAAPDPAAHSMLATHKQRLATHGYCLYFDDTPEQLRAKCARRHA